MVTVIGSNFGTSNNNPSVTIGGRPCQSVVWLSNSKLQCVSPPGIGIGDVRVFVLDLSSPENFGTIFEFDAPAIESLEPNHGPSTGGFYITVHGTNFGTVDSHPSIKVGGAPCGVTAWKSNEEVICVAPKGTGQDRQVVVDILGQPSKPAPDAAFSYDGPAVTALAPSNGPTIGGTQVTVFGSNFGDAAASNSAVKLGHVPCSSATWQSQSTMLCVTPPGVGGANQIEVGMNGLHSDACAQADIARGKCGAVFQYDRPIVDQVSPDHGATAGGYVVSVTGDNFGTTPSSLSLLVGRTPCSRTGWVSNSMATCLVPQGVGATRVVVEVEGQRSGPGGDDDLSAEGDLFSYDAPIVSDVLPRAGSPEGGQLVTVEGQNFGVDKTRVEVLVGDRPGRVVHVGETRILMVMPPGEGDRAVSVSVGGQSSLGAAGAPGPGAPAPRVPPQEEFQYSGPKITSIAPGHGPTQGGTLVTVEGKDLGTGAGHLQIDIGGIECIDSTWVSGARVTCTTPPGAGAGERVTVRIDGQYTASSSGAALFSYNAPEVRSVAPTRGAVGGGDRLLVQGLNFGLTDSHPVAFVGSTRCQATVWTDDAALACVTPPWGGAGPALEPVRVVVDGQESPAFAGGVFQFGDVDSPMITSLAWSRAPTDGGFLLTIYGSRFEQAAGSASVGRWGGGYRACRQTKWVSQSKVTCVVPPGVGAKLPVSYAAQGAPVAATFGSVAFEYDPPAVTSVSVSTGPVGGGIRVTLTGFGFGLSDTDPTAKIGGEACAATQWTSDSSVSCTTPAGRGRGRPVAVAVGGQASEKLKTTPLFNYEGPSISAAFPHSSPTAGGARITLYSREFSGVPRGEALRGWVGDAPGAKGSACEAVEWVSASAVSCTTPPGVGAELDVTVSARAPGGAAKEFVGFGLVSYVPPTLARVEPQASNPAGGLPVTVFGSSFGLSDSDPTVYIGETACARTLYASDTKLVCVSPPGGGRRLPVRAEVGGQSSNALDVFSYPPPVVSGVDPPSGVVTGGTLVTVTGHNFGRSGAAEPEVYIGGIRCASTTWVSDGEVDCVAPRGTDLMHAHEVTVVVQGVESRPNEDVEYTFLQARGAGGEGADADGALGGAAGGGKSRAPGVYLTIAYLVALGIVLAGVAGARFLFSGKANAARGAAPRRGLLARGVNKVWGLFFKSQGDTSADAGYYHIVDSIDIEMEASSEIDMLEQGDRL